MIAIQDSKRGDLKALSESLGKTIAKQQNAIAREIEGLKIEKSKDQHRVQEIMEEKERLRKEHEQKMKILRLQNRPPTSSESK